MLLKRLDATRPPSSVTDDATAVRVPAEPPARLTAVPAPEGLRRLSDIAAALLRRRARFITRSDAPEGGEPPGGQPGRHGTQQRVAYPRGDAGP